MIFADHDLARRLEGLEARFSRDCALARKSIRPEADTVALEVAGGYALFLGHGSPLSEAKGLGMNGPVAPEDLEAMERVFHDRGVPAKVMLCPMADPSLLQGLVHRKYLPVGFEDVLYRVLDPEEIFPEPPQGIDVAWAGLEQAEVLADTLARGFVAPEEPGPEMREIVEIASKVEGIASLMARVDGQAAGAASLVIREGLAMLAGAATLPPFRNRGIQTALAHARLARASKTGCQLATINKI